VIGLKLAVGRVPGAGGADDRWTAGWLGPQHWPEGARPAGKLVAMSRRRPVYRSARALLG